MKIKLTSNKKELQLKVLVDSGCTHTKIDKQLVKKEKIKTEPMDRLFEVFNVDKTKNKEVTQFVLLELEINRYIEQIDTVVMDVNITDIFLRYDWLVKHNPEVNWNTGIIQLTKCPREYKTKYQNITFTSRTQRLQPTDNKDNRK